MQAGFVLVPLAKERFAKLNQLGKVAEYDWQHPAQVARPLRRSQRITELLGLLQNLMRLLVHIREHANIVASRSPAFVKVF